MAQNTLPLYYYPSETNVLAVITVIQPLSLTLGVLHLTYKAPFPGGQNIPSLTKCPHVKRVAGTTKSEKNFLEGMSFDSEL